MAVAIRSSSIITIGNRTNTTVTAPSSIVNGDILLAVVMAGDAGDLTATVVTGPAGFTKVSGSSFAISKAGDNYARGINIFWKVASSEAGNYTFTHGAADTQAIVYALSGADTSTPITPTPTTASGDHVTGPHDATSPSITTTVDGSFIVHAVVVWDFSTSTAPGGSTPTFTERLDSGALYIADGVLTTAGATGDVTTVHSSNANPWRAVLFSVQAAGAAAITGTLAKTLDAVTLAANGDLLVQGAVSVTLGAVTLAANGNLGTAANNGALVVTIEPVVLTSDADLIVKGQIAVTIDPVTLAAESAHMVRTATLGVTIDPVTLAAYGSETGIPAGGGDVPYWGPSGGPKQPEKKKKKYKAPPPPRREGGHIPTRELRKAVRELLALEAAKEAEKRRKPKALAKEIVEELPAMAIAGLAKKEAISFVARELRQELPQSFYSEQVIRDNEKLMRIILLILKRLLVLALLTQQAAEDEEEEELIALLLSAA